MRGREPTLREWIEAVNKSPTDATLRARLAACLLRMGYLREAEVQLNACLALCPAPSRKRLLVVVLRTRVHTAIRRDEMLRRAS